MAGLTTAMLLADDGHQVLVLERDPAPVPAPAEAWDDWSRRGVNQFRLLHFLQPRFRLEAQRALPRVISALEEAGALRLNALTMAPVEMTGGPRDGAYTRLHGHSFKVEATVRGPAAAPVGWVADLAGVEEAPD